MIDVIDDVVGIVKGVPELGDRVYRRWPKKKVAMPAAFVSRAGLAPSLTDYDGSEVIASVAYTVDINATDMSTADAIASKVSDELAKYNLHRSGMTDYYDDQLQVYRIITTFTATVDKRGNTFTN